MKTKTCKPVTEKETTLSRARVGKIAQLPHAVREHINRYLRGGGPAEPLLEMLNGLPEVKEMLEREFLGEPISKQNLSAWRQGGYAEWEARQVFLEDALELDHYGAQLEKQGSQRLVEKLAMVLAGRYASLLMQWDGEVDETTEARVKVLGRLSRDVAFLQRSIERGLRLQMAISQAEVDAALALKREKARDAAAREETMYVETLKLYCKEQGFMDIDRLKAEVERRKAETSNTGKTEPTAEARRRGETGSGEGSVSSVQPEKAGETGDTQVVDGQGSAEPVKASQGLENDETRNQKSESKTEVPIVPEPKPEEGGLRN